MLEQCRMLPELVKELCATITQIHTVRAGRTTKMVSFLFLAALALDVRIISGSDGLMRLQKNHKMTITGKSMKREHREDKIILEKTITNNIFT